MLKVRLEARVAQGTSAVDDVIPERAQTSRAKWLAILLLAVVARFAFSLVFFRFTRVPPLTQWGYENLAIAMSLHDGHGFSSPFFSNSGPTAFMAPGYPLFLATIIGIFGTGSVAATMIVVLQELFSTLTVILVMYIARLQFGERTAMFVGFACAIAPPMLMAPGWIWDTALSALFLTGVFAAASASVLPRMRFIPAGAICAIAGLVNPALIPVLWAICGWSAWKAKSFPWAGILTFLLVFSPWPVRNAMVMHAFIPLRTDFGYELWMGNHPGGNGNPDEKLDPMTSTVERRAFLAEGEIAYLHQRGVLAKAYIRSAPAHFLSVSIKRFGRFWTGGERGISVITTLLFLLAVGGLGLLISKRRSLALLYALPLLIFPTPYYFTLAVARFGYVIDPLLAILAGHAVAELLSSAERIGKPKVPVASG
jgi:hypothetical protein